MTGDWDKITLRDVSLKTEQWKPKAEPRGEFYYIDVSAVSNDTFSITSPQMTTGRTAPGRARKIVRSRDIIYATIRPTLKRVALVPPKYNDHIASTAFCVVRADREKAVPEFLYFLLLSDRVSKSIADAQHGASYPAVTDKDILRQEVSLPPLPEQEKIAAVLLKLQRGIEAQDKIIQSLRDLKKSTMQHLFTKGLRGEKTRMTEIGEVPESWDVVSIEKLSDISAGGTPSRSNGSYWQNGTIPWVKTGEVDYCWIEKTEEHITKEGLDNSAAKLLPVGTLLIAMYGQGITRGKVARLGIEAATNQACAAIRSNESELRTSFLYYYLAWSYAQLRVLSHGAQQANLNAKIIAGFTVAVPPITEQDKIAIIVDELDRKLYTHEFKKHALKDLFKTALNKLMIGAIRVADLDIDVKEVEV